MKRFYLVLLVTLVMAALAAHGKPCKKHGKGKAGSKGTRNLAVGRDSHAKGPLPYNPSDDRGQGYKGQKEKGAEKTNSKCVDGCWDPFNPICCG